MVSLSQDYPKNATNSVEQIAKHQLSLLNEHPGIHFEMVAARHFFGFWSFLNTESFSVNPNRTKLADKSGEMPSDSIANLLKELGEVPLSGLQLLDDLASIYLKVREEIHYLHFQLEANMAQGWELVIENQYDKDHPQYEHFFTVATTNPVDTIQKSIEQFKEHPKLSRYI
ncbi:hypothetical protein [Vibrio alginolyticus]|uniref:hypothetical protein n=1 Tax=Vibrio alginolyticus TaxID=663 RepID=UPI0006CA75B6|nr:hypothetical protein [Vibrio alginolyticus]KPM97561.1 hypothetical protein AOG25_13915 [Vibrio alginolyticus]